MAAIRDSGFEEGGEPPSTPTRREPGALLGVEVYTPRRAAVIAVIDYLKAHGKLGRGKGKSTSESVFDWAGPPRSTAYKLMASRATRRLGHLYDSGPNPRGRRPKLTREQVADMEAVLDEASCAEDRQYT